MKCKKLTTLMVAGILLVALVIFGCSANRISLADQGCVSVKNQGSERIKILWTDVYQQDGQIWAYGVLKQSASNSSAIKTHVDVCVLAPDGSAQYETTSKELYVPRNRVGKGPDWKRFRVQLPIEISVGTRISMAVHSSAHKVREGNS